MPCRILIAGHSHLAAVIAGCRTLAANAPASFNGHQLTFVNFHGVAPESPADPVAPAPSDTPGGGSRADEAPLLPSSFTDLVRDFRPDVTAILIQGNEHNVLALVDHPRRFDFILPEHPDLPLDRSREILPFDVVKEVLRQQMSTPYRFANAISQLDAGRIVHLESPPPAPDDHVLAHPAAFIQKINEFGVAPAALRYKMWRVRSMILRDICRPLGIEVIASPPESQNAAGLLVPEARASDPTHCNGWYGALVMKQILGFADTARGHMESSS